MIYSKCADCLSPVVTAEPPPRGTLCGACGGLLETMGRIYRPAGSRTDRLAVDRQDVPCDDRCVFAPGPNCECRCGGENHGSGLLVTVTIDRGAVPTTSALRSPAEARRRAEEYRAALAGAEERFRARYGSVLARRAAGEYLGGGDWAHYLGAGRERAAIFRAKKLRTHKGRIVALARVLPAPTAAAPSLFGVAP